MRSARRWTAGWRTFSNSAATGKGAIHMNDMPLSAPQVAFACAGDSGKAAVHAGAEAVGGRRAAAQLLLHPHVLFLAGWNRAHTVRFPLLAVSAAYMAHAKIRPNAASIAAGALTGLFSLVFALVPSGMLTFLPRRSVSSATRISSTNRWTCRLSRGPAASSISICSRRFSRCRSPRSARCSRRSLPCP